jgi:nitrogen fixation protein FixH
MAEDKETKPAKGKKEESWAGRFSPVMYLLLFCGLALGMGAVIAITLGSPPRLTPEQAAKQKVISEKEAAKAASDVFASGRVVERKQTEDALGWGSELMVDKKPGKPAKLRFMLRDANKRPIANATIQVSFTQIGGKGTTPAVTLTSQEAGVYRGEVAIAQPGNWEAHLVAETGENIYQIVQRFDIP